MEKMKEQEARDLVPKEVKVTEQEYRLLNRMVSIWERIVAGLNYDECPICDSRIKYHNGNSYSSCVNGPVYCIFMRILGGSCDTYGPYKDYEKGDEQEAAPGCLAFLEELVKNSIIVEEKDIS
jgi:hypothetical protein